MECNRDEAFRAKELAERKMLENDFEGARKIALKARKLFPELDNISQLIAVCDVHCSAERKINGSEKDLYGILQVEYVADEATIRKQYRKLALLLHPDKNKFPGAEAAFKLVGEANMTLSDKGKRSLYEMKCRERVKPALSKPENRQGNQNAYVRTHGAQNKFSSFAASQFCAMNQNHHQQSQPHSSNRPTFWTKCPFCNVKYEYYREFINRSLQCQHCTKRFLGYDIGPQQVPTSHSVHGRTQTTNQGFNRAQPTFSQQKEAERQANVKVDGQKPGQFPSHFAHQTTHPTRTQETKVDGSFGARMKQDDGTNKADTKEENKVPSVNARKSREAGASKDKSRKRGRKMLVESSESGSDIEDGGNSCAGKNHVNSRKSSRQRQQVSYNEDAGDNLSPAKRSRLRKLSDDMQKEVCNTAAADVDKEAGKQKASAGADRTMANGKFEKQNSKRDEALRPDVHPKSNSGPESNSDPEFIQCPEPEFTNFDKDKEEHCFAVDQIWACYDPIDSMPRFYALVRKIFPSKFRMRITWLEAEPENDAEIVWAEEGLPVACGKFVRGQTEETRDRLMFSHRVVYEKGRTKSSYFIYPRKGEVWALFKDWDIKWSSDPENHTKYKFDVVEILSDYEDGVLVTFLVKVKGFVSLFQRTVWAGYAGSKIPASDLFRFSHCIPSVKLTGTERAGVPAGSFELDTASLPDDFEEYHYSSKVNIQPESVTSQLYEERVTPAADSAVTPKKPVSSEVKCGLDKEMLNPRRSPRVMKGGDRNQNQVNGKLDPAILPGLCKGR